MRKKLLFFLALAGCAALHAETVPALVVSADGVETKYELSTVQNITVNESSFTVNRKDGAAAVSGGTCLLFGTMDKLPTALPQTSDLRLYVYPNPVADYLQIAGADHAETRVYDVNCRLLKTVNANKIPVSDLAQGVYFLQVSGKTLKFVKK